MGEGKRGGQMVKSSYHIVWGRVTGRDAWSSEMYIYIWNDVSGRGDGCVHIRMYLCGGWERE